MLIMGKNKIENVLTGHEAGAREQYESIEAEDGLHVVYVKK